MHRKRSVVGSPVLQSSVGQAVGAGVGLETGAEVVGASETGEAGDAEGVAVKGAELTGDELTAIEGAIVGLPVPYITK